MGGIVTLDQHHRVAMSLEGRINAMQDDLERFAFGVADLAKGLGEAVAPTPADTARVLVARAARASAAESAWNQAQLGLDQAHKAAADGEGGLSNARIKLVAVIAACGAPTAEDAEIPIAASRAHSEQVARRNAARDGLAENGDGLSDSVLRAEADAIPADDMAAKRQEVEELARTAGAGAEDAAVTRNGAAVHRRRHFADLRRRAGERDAAGVGRPQQRTAGDRADASRTPVTGSGRIG